MNIQSLLAKLKKSNDTTVDIIVVVQPSALFFSSSAEASLPEQVPFEGNAWQEALITTLRQANLGNVSVKVILHANLYQTLQIDKPNVPEDELKAALPFLVKDLVSEKVTDIVADSALISVNNKLQVYVVSRTLVVGLYRALQELKIELASVLVEDELWGHSAGEASSFLLLQRSKQGQFRISAFVDSRCAFQRTIRGVVAPVTGVASSALQIDSLALELQRSIDYLSSQMRGVSLHQLHVCCDEEQQQELVANLGESLSVKVASLAEHEQESGAVLIDNAHKLPEEEINLFPQDLKPKNDHFTLHNLALAWLVTAGIFAVAFAGLKYQQLNAEEQLQGYLSQEAEYKQQAESLTQRLSQHKPTPAKVAAVARLKQEISATRSALLAVGEFDESQQLGYSGVMRSLAELGRNDISISSIAINATMLDLQGLAREAQAIPNWISQFKSELNLVGRSFEKLKINRNEQGIITFELNTKQEGK